jgi:hypothetical protein
MRESVEQYKDDVSLMEDMVEFHPTFLDDLSPEDRDVLAEYYFAGREVDVDELGQYRDELMAKKPGIEARAQEALGRFKVVAGIE